VTSPAQSAPHFSQESAPQSDCGSDHCITCSDEGVEMLVVEPSASGIAVCDGGDVMIDLVGPVGAGERLLVHAGVAIARVE
jgi:hypothetical protein